MSEMTDYIEKMLSDKSLDKKDKALTLEGWIDDYTEMMHNSTQSKSQLVKNVEELDWMKKKLSEVKDA